jgi:hypothetical protein
MRIWFLNSPQGFIVYLSFSMRRKYDCRIFFITLQFTPWNGFFQTTSNIDLKNVLPQESISRLQ